MAIPPVAASAIPSIPSIGAAQKSSTSSGINQVGKTFENMLSSLNDSQANADSLMEKLAQGEDVDLHTVMIGLEENDVNFNVALSIRDKLVDAYRQIMSMQV